MSKAAKAASADDGEAILFISRFNARTIVRDECKAVGITQFYIPENAQRCISYLGEYPEALLILDWEVGAEQATKVLESLSGPLVVSARQTLLIALDLSPHAIGAAAEYQVSRVHSGELMRAKFAEHIAFLLAEKKANALLSGGLARVSEARQSGDWDESLRLLRGLADKYPDQIRWQAEIIDNLVHLGRWDEASQAAQLLTENEPSYARGLGLYGRCLMRQKLYGDACEVFKRAKLLNPYNLGRLVSLGQALLEIDKVSEARENFEASLKLQRGRKDAIVGLSECMLLEGDVNDALNLLREVSGPRELASIFNMAAILSMRQGRFEIGKTLYQVAISKVKADAYLLSRLFFNLGIGYHRWQRPFDALECFEKAYQHDAAYVDAKANAAILAHRLGAQAAKAVEHAPAKATDSAVPTQFNGEFNSDAFTDEPL